MSLPVTVVSQRPSAAAVACAALLATGCDRFQPPPTPANAAAFVNQQPVTQEQLAQQMQRRSGGEDAQAEHDALQRLIDDELALQKARQLRIDRDPRVLQETLVEANAAQLAAQARPSIEQFLWNENKRRLLQADRKALREAATIRVVGRSREAVGDGNAANPASVN
jgi:hypothetical protein